MGVVAHQLAVMLRLSRAMIHDDGAAGGRAQDGAAVLEEQRLQILRSYGLLDSPAEESFDRITRLAARVFGAPIALISLVDEERQWFKSRVGLSVCETSRDLSFCDYSVRSGEVFVVPDTHLDPRFAHNALVTGEPHIRFYAGAPLHVEEGAVLGALCLIDTKPREFSAQDEAQLRDLAAMVVDEIVLRRNESLYRSLIEGGSDIVTIFDGNGVVSYQSPSLERWLGYGPGELVGREVFDLVHPDDREMVVRRYEGMMKNRSDVAHHRFRFAHKNGEWHTLECYARFLLDDPQVAGVVATSRDVTDRVRIEEQLNFSEQRFQAAFDQSSIGMALSELDGQCLRVNEALARITGYSQAELVQLNYRSLTHQTDIKTELANLDAVLRGEATYYELEKRFLHKDGHYLWAQVSVSLVRDGQGQPQYLISQVQDIHTRKRQEERLRLLESVAVNAQDAILITEAEPVEEDLNGPRILYANEAYCRMSGYTLEEVLGKTPRIMQGPDTDPEAREKIRKSLKRWKPIIVEMLNYRKDGTPFWVELSIVPVADERGWFTHWVSLQRDITQRKETEATLRRTGEEAERAREEAEAANAAKSEFLSRMSHELRTPLNAILGFGQLLELEEQNQNNRESTEQILKAGRHLLELINEVLDISHIETGKMSLSLEPVTVAQVSRETLDLVRPMAKQYGVTVCEIGVFDSPLLARGDRRRVKQILLNLLSNAIKYNHAGGRVTLWMEERGELLRLCVSDTGPGIAPAKRERLWVAFDRLDAETSGVEGTGIGLALSHSLAQAMGGTLECDAGAQNGSTFWLELPRAATALTGGPDSSDSVVPASATPASTRHVALYIDDNQSNVQLMQGILARRPDVRLLTAFQGGLGLELARQHCPDIILLDLHLPDMNGDEVLRHLRAHPKLRAIPVVMISADATPRQIERLLQLGANNYLSKPFDVTQFLGLMDDLIAQNSDDSPRLERELIEVNSLN